MTRHYANIYFLIEFKLHYIFKLPIDSCHIIFSYIDKIYSFIYKHNHNNYLVVEFLFSFGNCLTNGLIELIIFCHKLLRSYNFMYHYSNIYFLI